MKINGKGRSLPDSEMGSGREFFCLYDFTTMAHVGYRALTSGWYDFLEAMIKTGLGDVPGRIRR